MAKTLINQDFAPTEGSIACLKAWFSSPRALKLGKNVYPAQIWLMGDRHIDEEFISDKYEIIRFISFWSDAEQSGKYERKKSNWQTAFMNDIKKAWPLACMDYEKSHGKRSDSGSNGFKGFGDLTEQDKPKPVQRLKYKIPDRPPVEPMGMEEALAQLEKMRTS